MNPSMVNPKALWRGLRRALPIVALFVGQAQAAVYTGVWDPTFGAPFTGLGWRGHLSFSVPDGCVATGTVDVNNITACGGGAVVTHADVELYNATSTRPLDIQAAQDTLATLLFTPGTLLISTLRFVNGQITELLTSTSNFVTPGANLSNFGVGSGVDFSLNFSLTGPRLNWFDRFCGGGQCSGSNDDINFRPRFTITQVAQVAEPTTLWLGGLALLGALGLNRKRRRA